MRGISKIVNAYKEFRDAPSDLPTLGIPSPEANHRAIAIIAPEEILEFLEETRAIHAGTLAVQQELDFDTAKVDDYQT